MARFIQILLISCSSYLIGNNRDVCQAKQQERLFLYKASLDTSRKNYGMHIEIKQVLPDTKEFIPMSIDDRDIIGRSKYSTDDRIKILGEYLTFRGDTCTSNKQYIFKGASHMVRPDSINGFSVQIEALYSFTRMLTKGQPPIRPMLINRTTGEKLNNNAKVVSDVYDIYVKWYKKNKKNHFKNITLPLANSPYCWFGEGKDMEPYLKNDL